MAGSAADDSMNPSDEPQLKYEPLTGDVPTILQHEKITCLCLSDKILAIGTDAGVIHVLDYSGNQVKRLQHHRTPVNDLSFDSAGEHVASCSRDNCVVVTSLYTDVSIKHDYGQPVQALALDPRYASRKSKEVAVVLGQTASVQLSSQGWLGRSDTVLSKGPGTQLVRWWGPLIAWITGGAVMVYSTVQHVLVRTLPRPARGGAAAYSHASLLFGQNGWLYASWPDCVKVARTFTVENNIGGSTMQIEVVAEWTPHHLVLGVSPFGKDLAVLTFTAGWVPPAQPPVPGTGGTGGAQQQQQGEGEQEQGPSRPQTPDTAAGLQLRIMGLQGTELACDSLDVGPLPTLLPGGTTRSYTLVPSLPATTLAATASKRLRQRPSMPGHLTTIASFAGTGLDATYGIPPPLMVQPQPTSAAQGVAHHAVPAAAAGKPPRQPAQLTAQQARAAAIAAATAEQDTGEKPSPSKPGSARSSAGGSSQPTATAATAAASATTSQSPATDSSLPVASATTSQPSSSTPATPPPGASTATGAASPNPTAPPSTPRAPVTSTMPGGSPTSSSTPRHLSRSTSQALDASDQHPAYEPDAEFMYFVTTPQGVLVGRMRDLSDHSQWLLGQGRFAEALELQEKRPREIRPEVQEEVVQGYIGYLLGNSLWDEAAQLSRRLLRQDVEMWERWAYMFAQARQLPKLARLLPTDAPRLRSQVYDMVLTSLLANASDHATALELAQRWPVGCYSAPGLVDAVVGRMKRGGAGGDTRELWLLLSHLYEGQGRPDLALTILLQQQDPSAFTFIASHHEGLLAGLSGKRLTQLVSLDPARAIRLLVRHVDVVPPSSVVPGLQDAMSDAVDDTERDRWRRLIWSYLAAVHDTDPSAAQQYHELQVSLTADYAPGKLLELLSSSSAVPLEAALAICEDKGLVAEQVFILGRMGNSLRALHLIIDRLADIPQAIQFVQGQGDEELWEQLINWALSSPETTGSLLDHIGGHLNPLSLVKRIPRGLIIPSLRDRIRSIIADFRTQTSLREGCNVILRSDCARLAMRLHHAAAAAVGTVYLAPAVTGGKTANYQPPVGGVVRSAEWARYDLATASIHPLASAQELPPGVAQAETALLELKEVPGPPTGMVPAGTTAKAPPAQPHSRVWVGCLPAVSSEDALGPGVSQGWPVDAPAAPPGRALKPSSHPYGSAASRRRQQAAGHQQQQQLATKALRQQTDAQALAKENLTSLVM